MITLHSGEFYVTNKDELIFTLLGSCVSIVLIDSINKVYGMNHFMLVDSHKSSKIDKGKLGVYAIDLLINKMIGLNSKKNNLKAKVFGGANVLLDSNSSVPIDNINYAFKYLSENSIIINGFDVGGSNGRKIYFYTSDERVFVKKINGI